MTRTMAALEYYWVQDVGDEFKQPYYKQLYEFVKQEMIDEGEAIEVNCQFCQKTYRVEVEELRALLKKADR